MSRLLTVVAAAETNLVSVEGAQAIVIHDDALIAGIPGSRLSVYAGAGHAMHWEEPERFAAELAAFCEALGR